MELRNYINLKSLGLLLLLLIMLYVGKYLREPKNPEPMDKSPYGAEAFRGETYQFSTQTDCMVDCYQQSREDIAAMIRYGMVSDSSGGILWISSRTDKGIPCTLKINSNNKEIEEFTVSKPDHKCDCS